MSAEELSESDFVQYKVTPGALLGQVDKAGPMMCRIKRLPQPSKVYLNDLGVRTIEIELDEGGPASWLWVHVSEIEKWSSDAE